MPRTDDPPASWQQFPLPFGRPRGFEAWQEQQRCSEQAAARAFVARLVARAIASANSHRALQR